MELADIQLGHWTLVFSQVTGRVLDSSKWSETHVSGGGGGTPPNYGGNHPGTKSVDIRSTVTTEHEFWIKDEDTGKEQDIRLSGVDVPLRTGQHITLISVSGDGEMGGRRTGWTTFCWSTMTQGATGSCRALTRSGTLPATRPNAGSFTASSLSSSALLVAVPCWWGMRSLALALLSSFSLAWLSPLRCDG